MPARPGHKAYLGWRAKRSRTHIFLERTPVCEAYSMAYSPSPSLSSLSLLSFFSLLSPPVMEPGAEPPELDAPAEQVVALTVRGDDALELLWLTMILNTVIHCAY